MWPFRKNERLESYLHDPEVLSAAGRWFGSERSFAKFLLRFDEFRARRVIRAYSDQEEPLRHDPLEDDPSLGEFFSEVDERLKEKFPAMRRGMRHSYWQRKKRLLAQHGIDWLSPADLNPYARFD